MLLDNDTNIQKNIQDYANSMKKLRRDIKAYVAWVRRNELERTWRTWRPSCSSVRFEAIKWLNRKSFTVTLDDKVIEQIENIFKYQQLTLGYFKANKNINNAYMNAFFDSVKTYIEEYNLNILDYKITYKSL